MTVSIEKDTSTRKVLNGKTKSVNSQKGDGFFEKYKPVICFEPNAEKDLFDKLASEIDEDLFKELQSLEMPSKKKELWGNEQFWGKTPQVGDWDDAASVASRATMGSTVSGGSGAGTTVTGLTGMSGMTGMTGTTNMNLRRFLKHTERTSVVNKVENTIAEL